MKRIIYILILFLIIGLSSCKAGNPEEGFDKIKVGQNINQVYKLMGEADEVEEENYTNGEGFKICYWFKGASSQEDANNKYLKGIKVKYWCVIFYTDNGSTYKIEAKEDILTGYWGVS